MLESECKQSQPGVQGWLPAGASARLVLLELLLVPHEKANNGVSPSACRGWLLPMLDESATPSKRSLAMVVGVLRSRCSKLQANWQQSVWCTCCQSEEAASYCHSVRQTSEDDGALNTRDLCVYRRRACPWSSAGEAHCKSGRAPSSGVPSGIWPLGHTAKRCGLVRCRWMVALTRRAEGDPESSG